MGAITLTTDFGLADPYVGLVKGAILCVHPAVTIVDVTHAIDPQDCAQAARSLAWIYPYFPEGTVHAVIVDPGVGSRRKIIAFRHQGHLFLGPDNGVFTLLLDPISPDPIVAVDNPRYFRHSVSRTFHGRDIFAPVAAHLARGLALDALGPVLDPDNLVRLALPAPRLRSPGAIEGTIVAVDHFGNLISDIHLELLPPLEAGTGGSGIEIRCAQTRICGVSQSYAAQPPGAPLAIIGSRDTLEISINQGHAAHDLEARAGDPVTVTWSAKSSGPG
ncbi:MAG: SAM-dependent chlorinase/fluorinase [Desulfobacterales bacterium]